MANERLRLLQRSEKNCPAVLYHYTSLEALQKIVQGGRIWASNLRYLNDSSEYAYALALILQRIDKHVPDATGMRREWLTDLRGRLERRLKVDSFVASFSEKKDDLSQWRGYSPLGLGVCIGFHTAAIVDIIASQPRLHYSSSSWRLKEVEYIDERTAEDFDETVTFANFSGYGSPPKLLSHFIETNAPFVKNACFRDEAEWRCAFTIAEAGREEGDPSIQFRMGKSTLIPYVEFDLRAWGPHFVAEVWVGPSPNQELSVEAVRSFMQSQGMKSALVIPSMVPYRHW